MRQEVKEFFAAKNLPIGRMVSKGGRRGLTKASIKAAAEEVYDEIQNGLNIEDISIAWRVYGKAEHMAPIQDEEDNKQIAEIHAMLTEHSKPISEIHSMLTEHTMPKWDKVKRSAKRYFNGD